MVQRIDTFVTPVKCQGGSSGVTCTVTSKFVWDIRNVVQVELAQDQVITSEACVSSYQLLQRAHATSCFELRLSM
jgi:hypothetical protein